MTRRALATKREIRPGVWRVEVSLGRDPIKGKRRRPSSTISGNEADADREIARLLLDGGHAPSGKGLTVETYLLDHYLPWAEDHVRYNTFAGYDSKLRLHAIPKLGSVKLVDVEPYVLDRWRDGLLRGLSARSALHVYRALFRAFEKAVDWRMMETNPLRAVDPPKPRGRDLDTLTAEEALAYLELFAEDPLLPIVTIAIATGLRPCELYALDWSDLDLSEGTVRVRRGYHQRKDRLWFADPKNERSDRLVTLDPWAVKTLKACRGLGPLVPGPGGRATPAKIAQGYSRKVRASKLRYVPLRDLRHTHATLLLEAGVDVVIVSRRLGHSTVSTTDTFYLKPKRSADAAAAAAFGDLLHAGANSRQAPTSAKETIEQR